MGKSSALIYLNVYDCLFAQQTIQQQQKKPSKDATTTTSYVYCFVIPLSFYLVMVHSHASVKTLGQQASNSCIWSRVSV